MTAKPALFEVEKAERWTGSKALVPLARDVCPDCTEPLHSFTVTQPALIRHGGYGAMSVTESVSCAACGWHVVNAVSEAKPT